MSEKKKPTPEEKLKALRETLGEKEAEWRERRLNLERERDDRRLAAASKRHKAVNKLKEEAKAERVKVRDLFRAKEGEVQEEYQLEVDLCAEKRNEALAELDAYKKEGLKDIDTHLATQKSMVVKEHEDDDKEIVEDYTKKLESLEGEELILRTQIKRAAIEVSAGTAKVEKPVDQATEDARA